MSNLLSPTTMVNLPPQATTDRISNMLLDEEDERERVLLVAVGGVGASGANTPGGAGQGELGSELDRTNGTTGVETLRNVPPAITTYALSVAEVREVIRARATTRVPGTPAVMRGLVNVRGMVITVIDLATCLGHLPIEADAGSVTGARAQMPGSIVLLEHGNRLVGLAVDVVREVRALDDGGLVTQPGAEQLAHGFVRGLASAGGEVVTLLDVAALLSRHLISGES